MNASRILFLFSLLFAIPFSLSADLKPVDIDDKSDDVAIEKFDESEFLEQLKLIRQSYQEMTTAELAQVKERAFKGDIEGMTHYALYQLTKKNIEESLFWIKALVARAQIESMGKEEAQLVNMAFIILGLFDALTTQLQKEDEKFAQAFDKAIETSGDRLSKKVIAFIEKLEIGRKSDEFTAKRNQFLKELKSSAK